MYSKGWVVGVKPSSALGTNLSWPVYAGRSTFDASTVSRHVRLLRDAGLVAVRKEGRWLHCRRAAPEALLWHAIDEMLAGSDQLDLDERRLRDGDCC